MNREISPEPQYACGLKRSEWKDLIGGWWEKELGESSGTHGWHHAAGADAVVEARPALVIGVLALVQHVLVSAIVGLLVGHPAAALHSDGVTAAEVVLHLGTVTAAFVVTTLEVPVFVEDNLVDGQCKPEDYAHRAMHTGSVSVKTFLHESSWYSEPAVRKDFWNTEA